MMAVAYPKRVPSGNASYLVLIATALFVSSFRVFSTLVCVSRGGPLFDVGICQFGNGVFTHRNIVVDFYSNSLIDKLSLLDIA